MSHYYYYSNGEEISLFPVKDVIAIKNEEGESHHRRLLTEDSEEENKSLFSIPQYGIEVYKTEDSGMQPVSFTNSEVQTVPVLKHSPNDPNLIFVDDKFLVKFKPEVTKNQIDELNKQYNVKVIKPLGYSENGYVLQAPTESDPMNVVDVANKYYESGLAVYSHPNFIRERHREPILAERTIEPEVIEEENLTGVFFSQQWHLPIAKIIEAWTVTMGNPNIKVAILDDGVDVTHPEFQGKVVNQFDFEKNIPDGTPKIGDQNTCLLDDCHGTACAGVAVSSGVKAYGSAPKCSLIAVRTPKYLGVIQEGEMFQWATDNGADVISCSWGPGRRKGVSFPLTDDTREAITYCATHGRNGNGIPIFFAAGNYQEDTSLNGYCTHPNVITIAASSSNEESSFYSNFGDEVVVCAPSSGDKTKGEKSIFTTDRQREQGYNKGNIRTGDLQGDYTNEFGGTSSSTPFVAGVAGLLLSVNPNLNWKEIRDILAKTADKIGDQNTYRNSSLGKHSQFYGYGRINAFEAVKEALRTV
ncbi:S8 family serine peptidase [Bacillus haynesii]|uniref:S8 family serine peptidase n=1 Tax=Bacillus haynesii TaxID=1925021 RepID=UPI002281B99C|nr:S8 family serine peptidase [Bacillus haynesii]MCY9340635.1 S8 family serine peptidase [Bacillus haynesii]